MSGLKKVFIDGEAGTTGLQVRDRLVSRTDISLLSIAEADRKNPAKRKEFLNAADIVILCLPDEAAREAVALIDNPNTAVIDASTAHRVAEGWTYGFPEMTPAHKTVVANSKRISNPGCYPTGAIALIRPLIDADLLSADLPIRVNGVSGYSGGGKPLIALHQQKDIEPFGNYGLGLTHKHVPEMQIHNKLSRPPLFTPAVGHFAQGMIITIALFADELSAGTTLKTINDVYHNHYQGAEFINLHPVNDISALEREAFLRPDSLNGTNQMDLFVFGQADQHPQSQILLMARLDNLGKGASGAAVQNMNLVLGCAENTGL